MIFAIPGHIEMIRHGTKTQTRRLNRGIYQVGRDYAVQRKRGVKAETDIRIVMDEIWEEVEAERIKDVYSQWMGGISISAKDALAEGGYAPGEFEYAFANTYPKWDGKCRWVFEFHVIEVQK